MTPGVLREGMLADMFRSYDELSKKMTEGKDYQIVAVAENRSSNIAIVAPHGGEIEHGTSEIAKETAANSYRLYLFEGIMKKDNFAHLHITSHRFFETRCLGLIAGCEVVLAVHGRRDKKDPKTTEVSGLNDNLIDAIIRHLRAAGFAAAPGTEFPAKETTNICNRGRSRKGAQIEIPSTLRRLLERETERRSLFTGALRNAIDEVAGSRQG